MSGWTMWPIYLAHDWVVAGGLITWGDRMDPRQLDVTVLDCRPEVSYLFSHLVDHYLDLEFSLQVPHYIIAPWRCFPIRRDDR